MVVFVYLFPRSRVIGLSVPLLDIGLQLRYLLVDAGNVLLDNECEFLPVA